jgi:hypothetical protein
LGWTRTIGTGSIEQEAKQRSLDLLFATRLGLRTFASLGARRSLYRSAAGSGYRENALTASVLMHF